MLTERIECIILLNIALYEFNFIPAAFIPRVISLIIIHLFLTVPVNQIVT